MMRAPGRLSPGCLSLSLLLVATACGDAGQPEEAEVHPDLPEDILAALLELSPKELPTPAPDATNAYADDPDAAALGHKLFFDKRFSGPLLDEDNDGAPGTLGMVGDTGRVSCESCHNALSGFLDARSPRSQISLAAGWTRRRTPSILDVGHAKVLMWDGRRDTLYNQVFGVIESPLEFNSSRLFVAQQIARLYKKEYEAVFGDLPKGLDDYEPMDAADAGCDTLPEDPVVERCEKEGHDDPAVIEVLVNMGKAIGAYERLLACGPSRFDAWMHGEFDALTQEEQTGATLFVSAGCSSCHSGPYFSDQKFYNVGSANLQNNFIAPYDDPGAAEGLAAALDDPLNARGEYSDGDDGRLDDIPKDTSKLLGAFRTPMLRCVSRRPSFMHAAQKRSLEDAVNFFDRGGDNIGYQGEKDAAIVPLELGDEGRAQITAFLRALDGNGPAEEWAGFPELPE
jgi:cytochrome c peroxidase